MELKIKIHSSSDVITNSSTSIFVSTFSVDAMKKFINVLLKSGGSDKTADDLFEFEIINEEEEYGGEFKSDTLIMKSKINSEWVTNLTDTFQSIFNIEACEDR